MSHAQQRQFTESVRARYPDAFRDKMVLDCGSMFINGDNRFLFSGGWYLGVDVAAGRNVDLVSPIHELTFADGIFDTIVSTECFEHDLHWQASMRNIVRMLKPGGMFLFTCATEGRPEHGTRRTTPQDAPGLPWPEYYCNLTEPMVRSVLDGHFEPEEYSIGYQTRDLYYFGVKKHGDLGEPPRWDDRTKFGPLTQSLLAGK